MSNLVRYEDVLGTLVPIFADMLQKDDTDAARALKALETLKDVDLVKEIQERCLKNGNDCGGCEFYGYHNIYGCFWINNDYAPEDWKL